MTKISDNITIEIDGERFEIPADIIGNKSIEPGHNLKPIENRNGIYEFHDGKITHSINIISYDNHSLTYTIEMDGQLKQARIIRELDLMIEKMGMNAAQSKKQSQVAAPMPGLVTAIKVAPGDHVEKGSPLLILEAMKMENVISAPHDAVIKEIRVKVGQAVERGLALLEFE